MQANLSLEQFIHWVSQHDEFEARFAGLLDTWGRFSTEEKRRITTSVDDALGYETWCNLTDATDTRHKLLELEISDAFKDVKLEDGIGFHEADCIDDYLKPDDPLYQKRKALDDREDWRQLKKELEKYEFFSHHCFMDKKGLRFFLPVLLGRMELEFVLTRVVEAPTSVDRQMWQSLNLAQKNVVIATLEYEIDYRFSVINRMQDHPCTQCGKMTCHLARKGLTREEAVAQTEQSEDYVLLEKLKRLM
ncbi:MAG: hypothetical protein HEQ39_05820 [Rhizobacter sp.]